MRSVLIPAMLLAIPVAALGQSHLMRYADVSKDKIVFTYEDDLWLAPASGGDAWRITSDRGAEVYAKFSPSGEYLAFTAQYDGGTDVYLMKATGGAPERLTFHPAADRVLGWFPDGKSILFRSNRVYPTRGEEIYRVSIDGGMPQRLAVDRAGLTALSPDATKIAYNRISRENRTWKRHQGGTAQDIWMGSLSAGDFRRITDWKGTDNYPMWHGNAIYFTSDRLHGTLNIHKYDVGTGKVTAMTEYSDYDVKYPSLGGDRIVYQYGETLHLLDLKTGKSSKVDVRIPSDRVRMRPEFVDVEPTKGSFRLSPRGERLLLEARGEILSLPAEEGPSTNLTREPRSREKGAVWSPDGKWIAFLSDRTGEEELYLIDKDGTGDWKQITSGGMGYRMTPAWSPDSTHLIFADKFMRLNLVGTDGGEITVIDQGEYDDAWERWGIQDYVWSPDGKWIAYTKMEQSMYEAIFLYSLDEGAVHRVTDDMYEDFSPSFDPEGKYLYFLSNRTFDPVMGFVDQNHVFLDMCRPYMVLLAADTPSPFLPEESEVKVKEESKEEAKDAAQDDKKADEKSDEKDKSDDKKKDEKKPTRIDIEGIGRRILAVKGVSSGNYFRLTATKDGFLYLKRDENQFEKYQNINDETTDRLDLYGYDLEEKESKKVLPSIANYHLSADGKKMVYRAGSTYGIVDTGKEAKVGDGKVDLDGIKVKLDRAQEFAQIFNEAWRVQRDWFYDPGMHGLDWKETGEKYRKFVQYAGNRSDLNYLIGEMIAELNAGHTYIWGGDIERDEKRVRTGMLGIELAREPGASYYRIAHIIPGTPGDESERSPLDEPGCPVKEGDYLISIDGDEITTSENVFEALQNKSDAWITLGYNDAPSADGVRTHRVKTIRSESDIRYREWVNNNRSKVAEASGGRLAYVHIPDMGRNGLIEFARYFYPQYYKEGFVIDERYNGGGFTADMIIDRLERKIWAMTQPREGKPLRDPERVFHGPMVVLINADTGSSGEMFAEGIKRKNIAPLIGVRTWGGSVGIEPHQHFVDEGVTTPPQFGLYGMDRTWLIEGHGVEPDIEVENTPGDVLSGQDAQLQAGIEHLLKRLADEPVEFPPVPDYPDKSKKAANRG